MKEHVPLNFQNWEHFLSSWPRNEEQSKSLKVSAFHKHQTLPAAATAPISPSGAPHKGVRKDHNGPAAPM